MRRLALLMAIILLAGCREGMTRQMWQAPLPEAPAAAGPAARAGHGAARAAVVAGRTVVTPITVLADIAGVGAVQRTTWEVAGGVVLGALECGLRMALR